jgi:hypothetical protein
MGPGKILRGLGWERVEDDKAFVSTRTSIVVPNI